jgi:hypothetical protein
MPNTTNFNWPTPADTDLVKDGAAAIRNLGNGVDTSLVDLKGGTTGQILSKASNADMDFTFVTPNVGDITEVQAGTGISVASGTGPIPVITNTATTTIDAEGDLLVGDAADALQRLAIGSNGNVLTVDTAVDGKIKWAAPASGGKVLQVVSATHTTATSSTSTTWADTGLTASITPTSATSKILIMSVHYFRVDSTSNAAGGAFRLLRGSTYIFGDNNASAPFYNAYVQANGATLMNFRLTYSASYLDSPSTTSSTTYKTQFAVQNTLNSNTITVQENSNASSIILLEIGA